MCNRSGLNYIFCTIYRLFWSFSTCSDIKNFWGDQISHSYQRVATILYYISNQLSNVGLMLGQRRRRGPIINQHWVDVVSCLPGSDRVSSPPPPDVYSLGKFVFLNISRCNCPVLENLLLKLFLLSR